MQYCGSSSFGYGAASSSKKHYSTATTIIVNSAVQALTVLFVQSGSEAQARSGKQKARWCGGEVSDIAQTVLHKSMTAEILRHMRGQLDLDLAALQNDLKRLESLRAKLNFFKAIRAGRAELRHSDFLAFLLSSNESHGLGDRFLKRWLSVCLRQSKNPTRISSDEVDKMDLTDTEVSRETDRIDLLLVNRRVGLGVVIENKTDTGEHSNQLSRYWDAFRKRNASISKVVGIYLSPKGFVPKDPRDRGAISLSRTSSFVRFLTMFGLR
jgi:hypothetical protein